MVDFAPSVQMMDVPRDTLGIDSDADGISDDQDEDENKDIRYTQHRRDKMITDDDGFVSDSDGEEEEPRKKASSRRNNADHRRSVTAPVEDAAPAEDMVGIVGGKPKTQHKNTVAEVPLSPKDTPPKDNGADQQSPEPESENGDMNGDTVMVDVPTASEDTTPTKTALAPASPEEN